MSPRKVTFAFAPLVSSKETHNCSMYSGCDHFRLMLSERWDQHSYWQFGNYKNGKHHIKNKIFKITFIEKQNKLIKIQKQTNKIKTSIKINTCVIIFFNLIQEILNTENHATTGT